MEGGKQTHRQVLEQVAKQRKVPVEPMLDLPPIPKSIGYIWKWFCECRAGERLTYQELESWSNLTKKNLSIFEVETIMHLETLYLKTTHETGD